MKGWIDLKKKMLWLRNLLIVAGLILFVLATVGESIQRANWSAIGDYVDGADAAARGERDEIRVALEAFVRLDRLRKEKNA